MFASTTIANAAQRCEATLGFRFEDEFTIVDRPMVCQLARLDMDKLSSERTICALEQEVVSCGL